MSKPVVFVGMGGTGAMIMNSLFKKIRDKKGSKADSLLREYYCGLVIDTDNKPSWLDPAIEYFSIATSNDPGRDLENTKATLSGFDEIWPAERKGAPKKPTFPGAGQDPSYTVLALFHTLRSNWQEFAGIINKFYASLTPHDGSFFTDAEGNSTLPIVYVGGMCGGTGPGLNFHVPYIIRKAMEDGLGAHATPVNIGLLYTPEATSTFAPVDEVNLANAYANILTLDNWQLMAADDDTLAKSNIDQLSLEVELPQPFDDDGGDSQLKYRGAPYEMLYLLGNSLNGAGKVDKTELSSVATEYLYAAFCGSNTSEKIYTQFSNHFKKCNHPCKRKNEIRAQSYGSFCVGRLLFPRRNVMKYCGDFVAARWRQNFVDCSYDGANDFWNEIATKVHIESTDSVKRKFNTHIKSRLAKSSDTLKPGEVRLDNEKQLEKNIKSAQTSQEIGNKIDDILQLLDARVSQQDDLLSQKNAERVAEGLVQVLLKEVVNCLKGEGGYTAYDFEGKQGAFIRSLAKVAEASLRDVVGYRGKNEQTGIFRVLKEEKDREDKLKNLMAGLARRNKKNGWFGKPVKKDAVAAWRALKDLQGKMESRVQLQFASKVITELNRQLNVVLGRAITAFDELLQLYFVPANQDYNALKLPALFESDEVSAGIVETVMYDRNFVSTLWLTGWKEKLGIKPDNDPERTVEERYESLSDRLLGVSRKSNAEGPLLAALEKLLHDSLTNPDITNADLMNEGREYFAKARSIFNGTVAPEVSDISVWEAIWKESELEGKRSNGNIKEIFAKKIRSFTRKIAPLWTQLDVGDLDGLHLNDARTQMLAGPDFEEVFGHGHEAVGIIERELAGMTFIKAGQQGGSAWGSFIMGLQAVHGCPAASLFSFEGGARNAYEKLEVSAKRGGTDYRHAEYMYRGVYAPLAMGDASLNMDRELVIICEYITDQKFDFFKKGKETLPRIEKRGNSYSIVTPSAQRRVQGRENLYAFFNDNADMRDEVQASLAKWLNKNLSADEKTAALNAFGEWAQARSRKATAAMRSHFEEDARVACSFVERESRS